MTTPRADLTQTLTEVEQEFVGLWRRMGSLWGISPTMAEIHGLLFITGADLSMDDIMHAPGHLARQREHEPVQAGRVGSGPQRPPPRRPPGVLPVAQRRLGNVHPGGRPAQRREIDPILHTLHECRDRLSPQVLGAASDTPKAADRRKRVSDLLSFLTLVDGLAQRFFETQRGLRAALELLAQDSDQEPGVE